MSSDPRPWLAVHRSPLFVLVDGIVRAGGAELLCRWLAPRNLTILGSVANLIVLEAAGSEARIGSGTYLRVGLPVTVATVAWGLLVLVGIADSGG